MAAAMLTIGINAQELVYGMNNGKQVRLTRQVEKKVLNTSVVSFNLPDYEAGEVGTILSEDFDIAVRTGFHCAPFIHELLGTIATGGTVRASVSFFSEEEDIDAFIAAIRDIMGD